ncbi:MAG: HAD-IA family hydrolase [Clostridia bacterium]|nr:HAD-IA family hydrolase [Clostridia bacterium]
MIDITVMYYTYILSSNNNFSVYIGVTRDLKRRLNEHKSGKTPGFTKQYHVHKLVYYEQYKDISRAIAREKQLKGWARAQKDRLIEAVNPEWIDLSIQSFSTVQDAEKCVIVFDLGGTLMHYVDMPHSWAEYYHQGFEEINKVYKCNVSSDDIEMSVEKLRQFNPRLHYREIEYSPEYIFEKVLNHWNYSFNIKECIETFYNGLNLKAQIYPDVIETLMSLKSKGYIIAAFSDLPVAMTEEYFKKDIIPLLDLFDSFETSISSGFRKPNSKALEMIAQRYGVSLQQLVFVGDEEKDRKTAENAGCEFIKISRHSDDVDGIRDLSELFRVL